ncbi:MAG: NADP-dependent phosphogluconate dehydrogenase, partial [Betaproteobacteria bacterium]
MDIGIVGLGRMGANMARRLARGGVRVIAYDRDPSRREVLASEARTQAAENLATLAAQLEGERVILMMLPAGEPTEAALRELLPLLSADDTLVDGGNAFYRDSMARALELSQRGLRFVDAGVAGGVHGLAHGYCLMLGGTPRSIEVFEPFAKILAPAPDRGWLHCGPSGAGHFAKMIHNGVEYGMMQAFAEGFALLAARSEFDFDLGRLAETWRHGSVVRSWLLDLCAGIL